MATRKEVAAYAGVSVATVSNVVNGTKFVSEEVKQRVEDAIRTLDYHPNMIARGLATKETRHVAIMVDNLKNGYYTEMLEGAQSMAGEYGYIVSIILSDFTNQTDTLGIASRGLDGVILATVRAGEIQALMKQKACMSQEDLRVEVNYSLGIREAVASLHRLGHMKIAFLSGLKLAEDGSHPRWDGFRAACKAEGIRIDPKLIVDANDRQSTDEEAGIEAVQRLLSQGSIPTALMAVNDLMAIGAIRELQKNGYRVPEDISVIGCDNSQASKYYTPSLSTIDAQVFTLGRSMMHNLFCEIKGKPLEKKVIPSKYIERESVRKVTTKQN
ncbi:MAG: LacI family transcriptional regulator [Lachnospiraceae bacterium]|nr:LacI family transcriptional regulator [Lachnospiraceae bacterium]